MTIAAQAEGFLDAALGVDAGPNLRIEAKSVDTADRAAVAELDPAGYDHVLVLGYSDDLAPQPADTRTLVTLLHLRKLFEAAGKGPAVVSEMIDVRNRALAEVTRADDFVVSNKLVSLMLAQAAENETIEAVFQDLLDVEGSEIMMRPAGDYVELGRPVPFYAVVEAARRRGEVAFGHRLKAATKDGRGLGGVTLNPRKSAAVAYAEADRIIVLARE